MLTCTSTMSLAIRIASNVQLIDISTASAALGVDRESVRADIDSGDLSWAWDFAADGSPRREVRIWKRCLDGDNVLLATKTDDEVATEILGRKDSYRSGELQSLLCTTHPSILRWRASGELTGDLRGHTLWITRDSVVSFLKARRISA